MVADIARQADFDDGLLRRTPPNFAHWRWGTLGLVLAWLVPVSSCLRQVWDVSVFSAAKFGTVIKAVEGAISDELFWQRLRIVQDVNRRLQAGRTWASGCACREDARKAGEPIACPMQGRRMVEAHGRLADLCVECSRLADKAADGDMCSTIVLPQSLRNDRAWAFRCAAAMLRRKFGFLDSLPFLLARACDREVMAAARAQYLATKPELRHRISEEFFGPTSDLSADVEAFLQGGECSQRLFQEIRSLQLLPMTEEGIEAPHAHMQREKLRQRAASRSWQSCTNRLGNNLELYRVAGVGARLLPGVVHGEARLAGGSHPPAPPHESVLEEASGLGV